MFDNADVGFSSPWGNIASAAISEFVAIDPLAFDPVATRNRLESVANLSEGTTNHTIIVSHEALSSRPFSGEYYAPQVAGRVLDVFPDASILVIFREQVSLIHSLYSQHLRTGGRLTLEEFIGTGDEPAGFSGMCQLSFFLF
ncbi:hypothetical protein [Jannaschia sp. 2305UL9-9]|uniref:hypothetical protein n=1 Tax=Jannaschia sp. 2305UL9-9 TaxID=3121638 RepID=UPI003529882A